ncbi:hypothetical protein ACRAWF_03080 [Streptomyces sp. L7]
MRLMQPSSTRSRPCVHMWAPDGVDTWGLANRGLVHSDGEALLVRHAVHPALTEALLAATSPGDGRRRAGTVVATHANGDDHTWATSASPAARSSRRTRHSGRHQCVEPTPSAAPRAGGRAIRTSRWAGTSAATSAGSTSRAYGTCRPPPFSGRHDPDTGRPDRRRTCTRSAPLHTVGDLVVHLPEQRVVFAGDIVFSGDHSLSTGPARSRPDLGGGRTHPRLRPRVDRAGPRPADDARPTAHATSRTWTTCPTSTAAARSGEDPDRGGPHPHRRGPLSGPRPCRNGSPSPSPRSSATSTRTAHARASSNRSRSPPGSPGGGRRTERRRPDRQLAYRGGDWTLSAEGPGPHPMGPGPSAGSCADAGRHGRTRRPARWAARVGDGGVRLIVNRHTGLGNWTFSGAGGAHPVKPRPHRAASRIPRPAMPEVGPAAPESASPHVARRSPRKETRIVEAAVLRAVVHAKEAGSEPQAEPAPMRRGSPIASPTSRPS